MPEITIRQLIEKQGVGTEDVLEIQDASTTEHQSKHIKAAHLLHRANHIGDAPSNSLTTAQGKVVLGRYAPQMGAVQELTMGTGVSISDSGELTAADPHFKDLPYDGELYGLRDGGWAAAAAKNHTHSAESIGIEAPNDGKQYSRGNETWNDISTPLSLKADATVTDALHTELSAVQAKATVNAESVAALQTAVSSHNTRINTSELAVSTLQTGKADVGHQHPASDIKTAAGCVLIGKPDMGSGSAAEIPLGVNLAITDGKLNALVSSIGINVEDEGQSVATGASTLNFVGAAVSAEMADGKVNVVISGTGEDAGVPEAPLDHQTYARTDGAWQAIDPFLEHLGSHSKEIEVLVTGLNDLSDVVVDHESRISTQESLNQAQQQQIAEATEGLQTHEQTLKDQSHDIDRLRTDKADQLHTHPENQIHLSTGNRILGRANSGSGAAEALRVGAGLTLDSNGLSAAITTASNVGVGNGQPYKGMSGTSQQFRTIAAGAGISIAQDANTITISINGGLAAVKTIHTGYIPLVNTVTGTGEDQKYIDIAISPPVSDIKKCVPEFQPQWVKQASAEFYPPTCRLVSTSVLRVSWPGSSTPSILGRYYITEYN